MFTTILVIIGTVLVVNFWNEVVDALSNIAKELAELAKLTAHAAKLFVRRVRDGVVEIIHRTYYKENGKWLEKQTVREISEDKVPEWAKATISEREKDMTKKYERELQLTLS